MSLHDDLLEQAEHLARRDARKPKQANLRRAISAAYYALFHLLVKEATAVLVSDPRLRQLVPRAFDHSEMKQGCRPFVAGTLPDHLKAITAAVIPDDLKQVADTFINMQQERHAADYNVSQTFDRNDTLTEIQRVREAFDAWRRVQGEQIATVFLVNLLLGSKWKR